MSVFGNGIGVFRRGMFGERNAIERAGDSVEVVEDKSKNERFEVGRGFVLGSREGTKAQEKLLGEGVGTDGLLFLFDRDGIVF